jgi:hypothetical protein
MRAAGTTGDEYTMHENPRRRAFGIAIATAAVFGPVAAQAALGASEGAVKLAYVDPGSGSFIPQALVATLAGVAVAVSAYWQKIKRFFGIGAPAQDDDAADTQPSDD